MTRTSKLAWRRIPPAVVPLLVWKLAGCGTESAADGLVVRDSAGVRIAESGAPTWDAGDGWHLSDEPALEIGALDGPAEVQFASIAGVLRLADGRIVVGDQRAPDGHLRVYGPDGRFLARFAPAGEGPGELGFLTLFASYRGDSLATWDPRANRMSVFDVEGRLGRTQSIEIPIDDLTTGAGGAAMVMTGAVSGFLDDGSVLVSPGLRFEAQQGGTVSVPVRLLVHSPEGALLDSIGPLAEVDWRLPDFERLQLGISDPYPPLSVRQERRDRIYAGSAATYEIRVFHVEGGLERIIRSPGRDLRMTEAARQAYLDEQLRRAEEAGRRPEVERALRDVPFPATLPAYARLLVDAEDHLWIQEYRLPGAEGPFRWSVFDPDGRHLGAVEVPEAFRIHQIDRDHVIGVWTDELDVQFVRVYGLERGGG